MYFYRRYLQTVFRPVILLNKSNFYFVMNIMKCLRMLVTSSGQDGGVGRNPLLACTNKRKITTNLKSINNQKHQKVKLHGTPTTKELKKKSTRPIRPVRWQTKRAGPAGSEKPRQGSGPGGQG